MPRRVKSLEERLWSRCIPEPNTGCWLWLGTVTTRGYGQLRRGGQDEPLVSAHVAAWEVHNNARVPSGLLVCHTCDVRACVNPGHLFVGTHQENMDDMKRKGRKSVPRGEDRPGHVLTSESVASIRIRYANGGIFQRHLAEEFGVSESAINHIVNYKRWTHIP